MEEGGLKLRFSAAVPFSRTPATTTSPATRRCATLQGPAAASSGSVKGMVDGVVDTKTAAMFEPYVGGGNGPPIWTPEELNRRPWPSTTPRASRSCCTRSATRPSAWPWTPTSSAAPANAAPRERRHRVEHAEVPRPADIPRFKALGVIASTQALFANPDKTTLENYAVLLGPERAARANAFKLFDDAGAVQAFGSDWPVFSTEVAARGVYCAVTRTTPEGPRPGAGIRRTASPPRPRCATSRGTPPTRASTRRRRARSRRASSPTSWCSPRTSWPPPEAHPRRRSCSPSWAARTPSGAREF